MAETDDGGESREGIKLVKLIRRIAREEAHQALGEHVEAYEHSERKLSAEELDLLTQRDRRIP